jgi:hypothetical protein
LHFSGKAAAEATTATSAWWILAHAKKANLKINIRVGADGKLRML